MGKIFPITLIQVGVIVFFLMLPACGKGPKNRGDGEKPAPLADEKAESAEVAQELGDIKYSQTRNGEVQWELTAKGVQQVLDGPAQLQQVAITYYGQEDRVTVVTADSGAYDTSTSNAALRGNVLVNTSDGATLSTDALQWDQQTSLLTGQGDVRISRNDSVVRGKGFELAPESEMLTLFEVSGIIRQREINP